MVSETVHGHLPSPTSIVDPNAVENNIERHMSQTLNTSKCVVMNVNIPASGKALKIIVTEL